MQDGSVNSRPEEIQLAGGNVGGAVRVGDTVRRATGPWTPAIHGLLAFLNDAGLEGIPRVLGTDDDGREILTFLPGRGVDVNAETVTEPILAEAVRWLKLFHDTVRAYRLEPGTVWRNGVSGTAAEGEIICHHDPGAYNWIIDAERFAGVVDWDMAGPGHPIDDLAFMAWTAVPLFRPIQASEVARRLVLMADQYGDFSPTTILEHASTRMESACVKIADGQRRGDPGMLNLAKIGEPARTRQLIADLHARRPEIDTALL
jgi:hypothetical protein